MLFREQLLSKGVYHPDQLDSPESLRPVERLIMYDRNFDGSLKSIGLNLKSGQRVTIARFLDKTTKSDCVVIHQNPWKHVVYDTKSGGILGMGIYPVLAIDEYLESRDRLLVPPQVLEFQDFFEQYGRMTCIRVSGISNQLQIIDQDNDLVHSAPLIATPDTIYKWFAALKLTICEPIRLVAQYDSGRYSRYLLIADETPILGTTVADFSVVGSIFSDPYYLSHDPSANLIETLLVSALTPKISDE